MNPFETQILDQGTSNHLAREIRTAILSCLGGFTVATSEQRKPFLAMFWRTRISDDARRALCGDAHEGKVPADPPDGLSELFREVAEQAANRLKDLLMHIPLPARAMVPVGSVSLREWKRHPERWLECHEISGQPAFLNIGGAVLAAGHVEFIENVPYFRFLPVKVQISPDLANALHLDFRAVAFSVSVGPDDIDRLAEGCILKSDVAASECCIKVFVGNRCVAGGELVTVAENFGVRITEVALPGASLQPPEFLQTANPCVQAVVLAGSGKIKLRDLILLEPGRIIEIDRSLSSRWNIKIGDDVNLWGDVLVVDGHLGFIIRSASPLAESKTVVDTGSSGPAKPPFARRERDQGVKESTVAAVSALKEALSAEMDELFEAIQNELPQTIAYLLGMLQPDNAARIIDRLPPEKRPDIYQRLARPTVVDAALPGLILPGLHRRFEGLFGRLKSGGLEFAEKVNERLEFPLPVEQKREEDPPADNPTLG